MSLPLEGKLMKMTRKRGKCSTRPQKSFFYTTVSLASSIRRALRLVRMNVATNARLMNSTMVGAGALKAVGIILSVAMLVTPGAIAFLLARRFSAMLLVAISVAVLSSLAGIWLSFLIDSAPAPTIVLFMSLAFVATFIRTSLKARRIDDA
ncbi:metal ABC transporter permease, partial [Agrobacterium tumefaciens]|uniref:metal ABC transporter permease n=1 Tax=Agrobacterium tumefaciens TaxID=358 RepID=UPI003013972B